MWDRWKKSFDSWENRTAQRLEPLLKSQRVLTPSGALLTVVMKVKSARDRAKTKFWSGLGLPTKRDQERTLHMLNQLESRLMDLEERLEDLKK